MEGLILAIVCLAPWAFGSVDAWARFGLDLGIALLAILGVVVGWQTPRMRALFCAPSLVILTLTLLAVAQAAPLSASGLRRLAPWEAMQRSQLLPKAPERVIDDTGPIVPLPKPTLSEDPEASLSVAARLLAAWILFQAVLSLKDPRLAFRRFAVALAVNAALLAMVSMVQWLSWNGKVLWIRESPRPTEAWYSGGPFICHNHLAAYLNIGLGMVLAIFLASREGDPWFRVRSARLWIAYVMGIIVVGLFASHSRGGVLATIAAGVITFAILARWKMRLGVGILLVPGMVLLFLLATGSFSPFQRIASIANATSDIRWEIWKSGIVTWMKRPVWGMGLGTFGSSVAQFSKSDFGAFAQYGESEYVHMLVEGGLIGLVLGLVGLVSIGLLARKALISAPTSRDRTFALGGIFAVLALAFHWLCDFSLHVPGVGVVAVVVCGFLCRLGLDSFSSDQLIGFRRPPYIRAAVSALVMMVLSVTIVVHGARQARAEAQLWGSKVPAAESFKPSAELIDLPKPDLLVMKTALENALHMRPDWSEGHLRLGITLLSLYKREATTLLSESEDDAERLKLIADPVWLHGVIHSVPGDRSPTLKKILEQDSVHEYLIPAVRSFLEARRCCPVLALAQIELASLDYLMIGADPSATYLERGSRLVGADARLCELGAVVAVQLKSFAVAKQFWRRSLEANPGRWEGIVESSRSVLSPEEILHDVISPNDGRTMIHFAERVFTREDDKAVRELYFKEALKRLPSQPKIEPAERHCLEAYAWAGLEDRREAQKQMEMALILDPLQLRWRLEFIKWLLDWGQPRDAQRQLMIGLEYDPSDHQLRTLQHVVIKAIAEGDSVLSRANGSETPPVAGGVNR